MASMEQTIAALEKKGKDELGLLFEVGPEYFTTADLIRLLGQWEIKTQLFQTLHKTLIWIGASSPAWLILGVLFHFIGLPYLASFALVLFPVSAISFVIGLIWMNSYFKSKGYLEHTEALIKGELRRRERSEMTL